MALIGNPIDFDRIRQRYESIVYPESKKTFQDSQFNQIRDTYAGLLQPAISPMQSSVTPTQMGVLGGMGSQTISQNATQPGQQVQLRFNPATGQTETIIPEYMAPFRTDQQDFLPVSTPFETLKPEPTSEATIDPNVPSDPLLETRGGGGEGRIGLGAGIPTMNNNFNKYNPYSAFDRANISDTQQALTGLVGGLIGAPLGALSFVDKQLATKQLKDVFGITKSDMDKINENIESGMTPEEAINAFRQGSDDHKIGRDFIGTGQVDEGFGLVSDSYLRDLTEKYEKDFDEISIDDLMADQGGQDEDRNTGTGTAASAAASAAAADARDRAARTGETTSQPTSKQTTSQRRNNTGSRGPGGAGGRGPSTRSGRGQDTSGRGQAGGARGGDNPGNTGGTSRF
jgi:hypothetical protein